MLGWFYNRNLHSIFMFELIPTLVSVTLYSFHHHQDSEAGLSA